MYKINRICVKGRTVEILPKYQTNWKAKINSKFLYIDDKNSFKFCIEIFNQNKPIRKIVFKQCRYVHV